MPFSRNIDLNAAIFLAEACRATYDQFARGAYSLPAGYAEMMPVMGRAGDRPEQFGFVLRSDQGAIVAFRGTVTDRDCIADAEIFQTAFNYAPGRLRTHDGFTAVYRSLRDEVVRAVRAVPLSVPLCVTGHSLGGALATLLSLDIAVNMPPRRPVVYTFASPRVGNPLFATAFNREITASIRVVNVHDLVPRLPPAFVPLPETGAALHYAHVQREFAMSAQTRTVRGNHAIETYIEALRQLKANPSPSGLVRREMSGALSAGRSRGDRGPRAALTSRRRPG